MRKSKVWIYDDVKRFGDKYVNVLDGLKIFNKFFNIERMDNKKFADEMEILVKRQTNLRREKGWGNVSSDLDEVPIFIIDRDLAEQSDLKSFLTGDVVAYLVRCFSGCELIVEYRIGENEFDLTLRGRPASFADLNITSEQLGNPGLWGENPRGFRPWSWPQLPDYLNSFRKKVKDIMDNPGEQICKVLGIPEDVARVFPRSVSEFIGGDDPVKMTFREFVEKSGNGLQGRDKKAIDEMVWKIGAARISKWLERLVLPGQDILVDAPHLVSRYPSLLKGNPSNVSTWNKTANFDTFKNLGLDYKKIEDFRFKKDYWLSRPAWFWNGVAGCQKIKEVSEPWARKETHHVFCEDSSSFHKREECKEFVAESDSPYTRRFVRKFSGVKYQPRVRLHLKR